LNRCVAVFSGSSEKGPPRYYAEAETFGRLLGESGWHMVFGGGMTGLMGAAARGVHAAGGHVVGVIPHKLNRAGVTYDLSDELLLTDTLRERKAIMDDRADAFVILPGGLGTLEEAIEAITLKQLGYHGRPIAFLNTDGFYDRLFLFIEHLVDTTFVKRENTRLYESCDTPEEVIARLIRAFSDKDASS
jgi:cytokinin riboside 5'-monophosphate phosphoribohydrolase